MRGEDQWPDSRNLHGVLKQRFQLGTETNKETIKQTNIQNSWQLKSPFILKVEAGFHMIVTIAAIAEKMSGKR